MELQGWGLAEEIPVGGRTASLPEQPRGEGNAQVPEADGTVRRNSG